MAMHKFKIGQIVDFSPARSHIAASLKGYKVLRQMPQDSGELQYRIKSESEIFERTARESELVLR